jgi:5'-nucleotidase
VDEAFFMGGASKDQVLAAFGAQMFFDDQDAHVQPASVRVPSGIVPYAGGALAAESRPCNDTSTPSP